MADIARKPLSLLLSLSLACALLPVAPAQAQEGGQGAVEYADHVDGEVIVVYAADADSDDAEEALSGAGAGDAEELVAADEDQGAMVLAQLDEGVTVEEAIEALEDDPSVAYAQPNYTYELMTTTTSDPYNTSDVSSSLNQYYLYASAFSEAWDLSRAEGSVSVAVVDTGCNLGHEDLQGTVNAELAYDATSDTMLADADVDNDGDSYGHGTLVTGVIAAYADNGLGLAGASFNATVVPVKVFDEDDECETSDIVAAYDYLDALIDTGQLTDLAVINMSVGSYTSGDSPEDQAMHEAIADMLEEHDVLTVCAGGNGDDSGRAKTEACYPADFDECVSVTALDAKGANATYSDYNGYKDISAYGEKILSTAATGGYAAATGTSVAAPQVAAAVALMLAANPDLTSSQVFSILTSTATAVTGNYHRTSGSAGALDAQAAVELAIETEGEAEEEVEEETEDADVVVDALFPDVVDSSKYYYESVYQVAALGLMTGYDNGYFGVGDSMSRAQLAVIMWRIACPEEAASYVAEGTANATGLSDVSSNAYYTGAANWAVSEGVINGKKRSDGTRYFDPGGAVTFQQFCCVLANYLDAAGRDGLSAAAMTGVLHGFSDQASIASWARQSVAWSVRAGLVNGTDEGALKPASRIKRERAATVFANAVSAGVLAVS